MGRTMDEAYRNALLLDGAPLGFISDDRPELPLGTTRQAWWVQSDGTRGVSLARREGSYTLSLWLNAPPGVVTSEDPSRDGQWEWSAEDGIWLLKPFKLHNYQVEIGGAADSVYNITVSFCGLEPQVELSEAFLGGVAVQWGTVMCLTSAEMGHNKLSNQWSASLDLL
eukprot:1137521-Prorocentrum_minimum.AAC.1